MTTRIAAVSVKTNFAHFRVFLPNCLTSPRSAKHLAGGLRPIEPDKGQDSAKGPFQGTIAVSGRRLLLVVAESEPAGASRNGANADVCGRKFFAETRDPRGFSQTKDRLAIRKRPRGLGAGEGSSKALKLLQNDNLLPDLTIVGGGPEEGNLRKLSSKLSLDRQVTFAGPKSGAALVEILNRHRILVVPSRWAEPFGVVALEGIACGCVVVGSENGGLKEAIGPCGLTFENGNASALAAKLKQLLNDPAMQDNLRQHAAEHLAKFKADAIAAAYLRVMQKLVG